MKPECIVLFSGGLDSAVAAHLMKRQGLSVTALNFVLPFKSGFGLNHTEVRKSAESAGIPLIIEEEGEEYLNMVKTAGSGYGRSINPCIDCRIFRLKRSLKIMEDTGASFIVTGEVIGQRPMSQRIDAMNRIVKKAGVKGLLLRPLSAKSLEPTLPEQQGIVDRDELMDIKGRGRKRQIEYAGKHGLRFSSPGGGCVLTEKVMAVKYIDLIKNKPEFDLNDFKLLAYGRHFRLNHNACLVIGRDDRENWFLEKLVKQDDIRFTMAKTTGPLAVMRGKNIDEGMLKEAASMTVRYSRRREHKTAEVKVQKNENICFYKVKPADDNTCNDLRI